jgi:pyridoxine/pyridoxamine 5'-phosphate oxidase
MLPWIKDLRTLIRQETGGEQVVCVLATADASGKPSARCMLLRKIDDGGTMLFVSDRKTAKDDQIRGRPECELVFWLANQSTQVRVKGRGVMVDAVVDAWMREQWWRVISTSSRSNFIEKTDTAPTDDQRSRAEARTAVDSEMPATFEMLAIYADHVEITDLRTIPQTRRTWSS